MELNLITPHIKYLLSLAFNNVGCVFGGNTNEGDDAVPLCLRKGKECREHPSMASVRATASARLGKGGVCVFVLRLRGYPPGDLSPCLLRTLSSRLRAISINREGALLRLVHVLGPVASISAQRLGGAMSTASDAVKVVGNSFLGLGTKLRDIKSCSDQRPKLKVRSLEGRAWVGKLSHWIRVPHDRSARVTVRSGVRVSGRLVSDR